MIVKSILCSVLLFIVANTYLLVGSYELPTYFQSPRVINRVLLDRAFLDYDYQSKAVLVGSSLTNSVGNCQDHRFINLGFLGKGNLDGLTILSKVKDVPKLVFVEINLNARDVSHEVLNYEVDVKTWLFSYFPIFRTDRNLVSHLAKQAYTLVNRLDKRAVVKRRAGKKYDELVNEFVKTSNLTGVEEENLNKVYKLATELKERGAFSV